MEESGIIVPRKGKLRLVFDILYCSSNSSVHLLKHIKKWFEVWLELTQPLASSLPLPPNTNQNRVTMSLGQTISKSGTIDQTSWVRSMNTNNLNQDWIIGQERNVVVRSLVDSTMAAM